MKNRLLIVFIFFNLNNCSTFDSEKTDIHWERMHFVINNLQTPEFPDKDFLITDFMNESETDISAAISKAIGKVNAEGGGRIILPEGEWYSKGPIHLKSNINLHLSEGAVLRFSEDPADYMPQVFTRWEGTELFNLSPLIYAYQATNVAVTGNGLIDGNSERGFGLWRDRQTKAQSLLREMGAKGVPVFERVFGLDDFLRPSMIQFVGCSRVLIEGVKIVDSPMWVIHLIYSGHVIVRDVIVESYRLNNDGIDIDSSEMVLIEGNSFFTGDDSIVIKSGRDQDAWRVGRPSQDIVIRDNYMEGHNALAIGSEMSAGVRNVFMENNQLGKVRSALYFKSNLDRGGAIEQIRVRDIDVDEAVTLLRFRTDYHGYRGGNYPPKYQDFLIKNITARRVNKAIEVKGVANAPILDIKVQNVNIFKADVVIDTAYVKNLTLQNVYINGEQL